MEIRVSDTLTTLAKGIYGSLAPTLSHIGTSSKIGAGQALSLLTSAIVVQMLDSSFPVQCDRGTGK